MGRRDGPNPYIDLPGMEMYAYEMGEEAAEWAEDGEFNGFSLSEYFKATKVDADQQVDRPGAYVFEDPTGSSEFLEMLRGKLSDQMKVQVVAGQKAPFPYESPGFHRGDRHSVWYMADVASCFAMRDMLEPHPYFTDFEIVVAAGARRGPGRGGQAAGRGCDRPRDRADTSPARSRCRAAS